MNYVGYDIIIIIASGISFRIEGGRRDVSRNIIFS